MCTVTSSAGSNGIPIKFPASSFPLKPSLRLYETLGDERPRVTRGELLVRRTWNSTSHPFFAGAAIFGGGKDSMRYGRHYELVKFNVFIIARFPRCPRTKRATVNQRFLALLPVVSPFGAARLQSRNERENAPLARWACFLPLIISMPFFKEGAFVVA